MRQFTRIETEEDHSDDEINDCHRRNDLGGCLGDRFQAAKGDDRDKDCDDGAGDVGGDPEPCLHGSRDRIHLRGRTTAEHGRHDAEDGESDSERLPFLAKTHFDIVHRAAGNIALVIHPSVLDRKAPFRILGRHAEESGKPHPEERARAAELDRRRYADDVSRADRRSERRAERLEAVDVAIALVSRKEDQLQRARQFQYLQEREPAGQKYPGANEKHQKPWPPHEPVDLVQNICHLVSSYFPFL